MMDNMSAGHELLRQKEERLKVMENALLGGLVRNISEVEQRILKHTNCNITSSECADETFS